MEEPEKRGCHCDATYETMQEFFSHEARSQRANKFLREYYSKLFGNERSHLEEAPFFDVCKQFPQGIMHVFLEVVLAYELEYLLRHYIKEESTFSLQDLNQKYRHFLMARR